MLTNIFFAPGACLSFVGCVHCAICVLLHWFDHVDGHAFEKLVGSMAGCPCPVAKHGMGTVDGTQDEVRHEEHRRKGR